MKTVFKFAPPDADVAASGVITATLSSEAEDRDGDVILASAWDLQHFDKHPVLMANHDYTIRSQIGHWENVRVDRGKLVGEPHYYSGQGNADADWAEGLARQGKAAFSVGFVPLEERPRKGYRGSEYTRVELLEVSQVALPSNRDALQNMMKSLKPGPVRKYVEDVLTTARTRQPGRTVRKWDSAYMDSDDAYGPLDVRCIVAGCDDASQTQVPICAEHLKYLMNSDPEPPGSPPDDDDLTGIMRSLLAPYRTRIKAGRTISAANMGKLHGAMMALNDVHGSACTADDCPLQDDGTQAPATERDKAAKAMNESSGSAGGAMVSEGGTHGAFGTADKPKSHAHPHAANGVNADENGLHEHEAHEHAGDGSHGHAHDGSKFKTAIDIQGEIERGERKAVMSSADQNDLPDSAFAVVSSGGKKDDEGKTTPRSLRHLPHHKADGSIDLPHLKTWKNALSRVSQTDLTAADKAKAEAHLEKHAADEGIGEAAKDDKKAFSAEAFEDAVTKVLEGIEW